MNKQRLQKLAGVLTESKDVPVAKTGYSVDVEKETTTNPNYRKVLYTTHNTQLVLMSLKPGEEIGEETHQSGSQFIRFESGTGKVTMGDEKVNVKAGTAVVIPQGMKHNVTNTSKSQHLKLYVLYSPPEHDDGTVQKTKT